MYFAVLANHRGCSARMRNMRFCIGLCQSKSISQAQGAIAVFRGYIQAQFMPIRKTDPRPCYNHGGGGIVAMAHVFFDVNRTRNLVDMENWGRCGNIGRVQQAPFVSRNLQRRIERIAAINGYLGIKRPTVSCPIRRTAGRRTIINIVPQPIAQRPDLACQRACPVDSKIGAVTGIEGNSIPHGRIHTFYLYRLLRVEWVGVNRKRSMSGGAHIQQAQ